MKALVTGAAGFIGYHVAQVLLDKGCEVRALVRTGSDTHDLARTGIEIVRGDIRSSDDVRRAVAGCGYVFHVAADYRLWVPDPEVMYACNVAGTRTVMQAARDAGVDRVVYTSSVGTLATTRNGCPVDENTPSCFENMTGHYKRSKYLAEQEVAGFARRGLPVVIVNPSTPLGPMDKKPTPTGKIIVDFLNRRIPAYLNTGLNFVGVEDVAAGHWLAAQHGRPGERYILGNRNMTLKEFFSLLAQVTGGSPPRLRLPYLPVLLLACADELVSRFVSRRPPMVPLTGVRMARNYMFFECSKAVRQLHMPQTPIETVLKNTVAWFQTSGYVHA